MKQKHCNHFTDNKSKFPNELMFCFKDLYLWLYNVSRRTTITFLYNYRLLKLHFTPFWENISLYSTSLLYSAHCFDNYTVNYKNATLFNFFSNNSVKNRPIFVFIVIHTSEDICNHTVVMLPPPPNSVCTLPCETLLYKAHLIGCWRNLGAVCFWQPIPSGLNLVVAVQHDSLCVVSLLPCVADCYMMYTVCKVERFVLTIIKRRLLLFQ